MKLRQLSLLGTCVLMGLSSQARSASIDKAFEVNPLNTQTTTIVVVAGSYGRNCGAQRGNATLDLARHCDGQQTCGYTLPRHITKMSVGSCRQGFVAEWRCGKAETHIAELSAGAAPGDELVLTCAHFGSAGK
jgi:hypothetical protein